MYACLVVRVHPNSVAEPAADQFHLRDVYDQWDLARALDVGNCIFHVFAQSDGP
jgi:hypothetical protein